MRRAPCTSLVLVFVASACGSFSAAPSATDAGLDGGADGGASSSCDASSGSACREEICTGGTCALAVSCKALHEARAELSDGLYLIDSDGTGSVAPAQVYCDMSTDGGGWTLVGRSVERASSSGGFGWGKTRGAVDDDTQTFSLGARQLGLEFTEILFGARGDAKAWAVPVYKHTVPAKFVETYRTSSFEGAGKPLPATVLGTCAPTEGPTMLRLVGHTSTGDHFVFTDDPGNPAFGLFPDGWETNGAFASPEALCSYTGELTGKQGMIFVR